MLDAGHGGKDPGGMGNGLTEKDLTLKIALMIGKLLEARGVTALYTRTTDFFVELDRRAAMANEMRADYFISIHINAGGGTGFESFTCVDCAPVTSQYREVIHRKLAVLFKSVGLPDRGMKQADLRVLNKTDMSAVLLEYGFIDRDEDARRLKDQSWLEQLAETTVEGIVAAFNIPQPAAPQPPAPPQPPGLSETEKEFAAARDWAVQAGITDGLRPEDTLTRQEFWTILYRMKNKGLLK